VATCYYADKQIRITSAELWVDGVCYRLAELTYVWHHRGGVRALTRKATYGGLMLLGGAVGLVLFWIASTAFKIREWGRTDLAMALAIVVVGFGTGAALTWPLWELLLSGIDNLHMHGLRTHEIWAQRRGEEVLLLRTSDALRFGQIYRALQRALEGTA
jgi:predicted nucleic acid-binding protein